MHARGARRVEPLQRLVEQERLVDRVDREVREDRMARFAGGRRPALDGDAKFELARRECLDFPQAGARFGRMQVDRGIRDEAALQHGGDAPRVALARRAGHDHPAARCHGRLVERRQRAQRGRHAEQVVGHAPSVQPPVGDRPAERVARPCRGSGDRLAIRVREQDQAVARGGVRQPADDADPLAGDHGLIGRELADQRHRGRRVGDALHLRSQRFQPLGDDGLDGPLAMLLGADQPAEQADRRVAAGVHFGQDALHCVRHSPLMSERLPDPTTLCTRVAYAGCLRNLHTARRRSAPPAALTSPASLTSRG